MVDLGVVELVSLAVTLALAVPIAIFGTTELLRGNLLGVLFLALAALLLIVEQWLFTPSDIPEAVAGRVVNAVAESPDEE